MELRNELDILTKLAMELQAIAQNGLAYTKDPYDEERFERVREIAAQIMSMKTDLSIEKVREEAGLDVIPLRIIAMQDRNKHNSPAFAYGIRKVFVLCSSLGGSFQPNNETSESNYFALDQLPALDENKNIFSQIQMCFDAFSDDKWEAIFD